MDGRVVYSASGCSLAEKTDEDPTAVTEDGPVPLDHDSPYQISKVVGEFYCVCYHSHFGLPTVRARFQNVYGPGETLGAGVWRGTSATVWRNVVPTFVYRALKGLPLRLDNAGQASRDFIFVDDIVEGLLRCGSLGTPGDVYNLAAGVETTIRELAETILRLTGSDSELELAPRRSWDHAGRRFGSPAKARARARLRGRRAARGGPAPHRRVDAGEPRPHRRLRRAPRGAARDGLMAGGAATTTRVWRGGAPWTRSAVDATPRAWLVLYLHAEAAPMRPTTVQHLRFLEHSLTPPRLMFWNAATASRAGCATYPLRRRPAALLGALHALGARRRAFWR